MDTQHRENANTFSNTFTSTHSVMEMTIILQQAIMINLTFQWLTHEDVQPCLPNSDSASHRALPGGTLASNNCLYSLANLTPLWWFRRRLVVEGRCMKAAVHKELSLATQGKWMKPARQKQKGTKLRKWPQPWLWVWQAGRKNINLYIWSIYIYIY